MKHSRVPHPVPKLSAKLSVSVSVVDIDTLALQLKLWQEVLNLTPAQLGLIVISALSQITYHDGFKDAKAGK